MREPSVSLVNFINIMQTSAVASVSLRHAGTEEKTVRLRYRASDAGEWSATTTATTKGSGTTIPLTGLTASTTYKAQVWLTGSAPPSGARTYTFTTLDVVIPDPSIATIEFEGIGQTSATVVVKVADAGAEMKEVYLKYRIGDSDEWTTLPSPSTTHGDTVSIDLSGLREGTDYDVAVALTDDFSTSLTNSFTTVAVPRLSGVSVSSVTDTSAVASVSIARAGAGQKTVSLQYRELGEDEWGAATSKTTGGASATFDLSGLEPDTGYQVRAYLSFAPDTPRYVVFTTLSSAPGTSVNDGSSVAGVSVGSVTQTSAVPTVTIANAGASRNTVYLRYRESGESGWTWKTPKTTQDASVPFELSELAPGTRYEVEASLSTDFSGAGSAAFTTLAPDPLISGVSVQDIAETTATAIVTIANADGQNRSAHLRYRTTTPEGSWSAVQTAASSTGSASVSLTGLAHGAEYQVQASLDDSFPATRTKQTTFTTLRYPSISSVEAMNVGRQGASVRVTIADSRGEAQTVYVRHRRASNSAWRTTDQTESENDIASLRLGDLSSGTEYTAEASLDDSFPPDGTKSVTFTTRDPVEEDEDEDDRPVRVTTRQARTVQSGRAVDTPLLGFSPLMLTFTAVEGGDSPPPQTFQVWNRSSGAMRFTLSHSEEWLSQDPPSGMSTGPGNLVTITASVDSSGLASGKYVDVININVGSSDRASGQVNVTLDVLPTDYVRQFVSRAEGGVVMLPDGTMKIVVPPLAPPKDADIELMKVDPETHGAPPEEQDLIVVEVVEIDSNTYSPGGDTPEDAAYSPSVELWILLTDGESTACAEGRAKVYEVVSGDWRPVEHRCETDESGRVWIVSEIERLGAFALVTNESAATPTPVAAAVTPAPTPTPVAATVTLAATPTPAPAGATTIVLTMPQGTTVQRTLLTAQAPTPIPTQAPALMPAPNGRTETSPALMPTPAPTAAAAPTQESIPVLQAATVEQSSGEFNWMMLAALGALFLAGAFIVIFLVYRGRRRDVGQHR